jgi:hypothetical protein
MGRGALPVGRAAGRDRLHGVGPHVAGGPHGDFALGGGWLAWFGAGLLEVLLPLSGVASAQQPRLSATGGEPAVSEPPEASPDGSLLEYWAPRKMQFRFGLSFESGDRHCTKVHATLPFPTNWPEQEVTVVDVQVPANCQYQFRPGAGGILQLVVDCAVVPPRSEFKIVVVADVEKSFIRPAGPTDELVIPRRPSRELKLYLGDSPGIDTRDRQIRSVVQQIRSQELESAWAQVEAYYEWVRETITYREGELRTTKEALRDGWGDCEEMTGIFVALCRASGIPARCVWIPEHCYAEFYLEQPGGEGYWFPAQLAGDRQFGEMNEYRPILQKGDRFTVPEKSRPQRYVAEFVTGKERVLGPEPSRFRMIRDLGELQQELDALQPAGDRLLRRSPEGSRLEQLPGGDDGASADLP